MPEGVKQSNIKSTNDNIKMTAPSIKRMTPIVASHLSLIKYNPKIAINKPKNITIINAITIPTPPFRD